MVLPDSDGISRVPPYSGYIQRERSFDYGVVTLYDGPFRSLRLPRSFVTPYRMSYNPKRQASWFGAMFRFARRYSGNRICFLFLQVLRCFSSWVCLPYLCIQIRIPYHYVWWVSPFGNLRIKAYLQLPEAYRR